MIVRPATDADLRRCTEVWLSTQSGIVSGRVPILPLYSHALRTGRLLVAEIADGELAGFGATLTRSGVAYLTDLFVTPRHQSRGIGRRLLQALLADHRGPLFTFASSDPRAQRLYEQFGMSAVEQYHYLDAPVASLVGWEVDLDMRRAELADVVARDAAFTGRDRRSDIDFGNAIGATWFQAMRDDVCVGAVAVVAPVWWNPWHPRSARIGPVMADEATDIVEIISGAIAKIAPLDVDVDVDVVSTFVPSTLVSLPTLLQSGFEIVETDLLMASDEGLIDRRRYLPTVDTP